MGQPLCNLYESMSAVTYTMSGRTRNRWLPHMWKSRLRLMQNRGCKDLYVLCASGAQRVLLCEGWGVMASQLDQPSLGQLSKAGCGRLQLGAAHKATSVTLLQVVDN